MPATVRYDEQYCPIARALDVLGDRWTLLILRELVGDDRRFSELKANLPGITPAILSQRLRTLTEQGLVESVEPADGTRRGHYRVTSRGREAVPVMRALARFGMPLLEPADEAEHVRPWTAVNACVAAYFDREAAHGVDQRYLLRVDGEEFTLSSVKGGGRPKRPVLVIDTSARTLVEIRQGGTDLSTARRGGALTVDGSAADLRTFARIFRLA